MNTMTYTGTLVIEHCCKCAMAFAMPSDLNSSLRNTRQTFYCPLGHPMVYTGEASERQEIERLKRKLLAEKEASERIAANYRLSEHELRKANITKKQLTGKMKKIKERIHNGVCPQCNRQFENLHQHMITKHGETEQDAAKLQELIKERKC